MWQHLCVIISTLTCTLTHLPWCLAYIGAAPTQSATQSVCAPASPLSSRQRIGVSARAPSAISVWYVWLNELPPGAIVVWRGVAAPE